MDKPPATRKPRSPIKAFLRPRAGTTLRGQLIDAAFPICFATFGVMGLTAGIAAVVMAHRLIPEHTYTVAATVFGLGWAGCGWVWFRSYSRIRNLQTGLDGELDVAQTLDELRESGYRILHSIDCGSFDIDHAVIGPSGVYVVETKTISKRGGAEEQVHWDGKEIRVGGHRPDRDPAGQAAALARKLHQIILDHTGESVFVQPAVVYPGWFVVNKARDAPVWVDNPKQLVIRIKGAQGRLDATRIARVSNAVVRHQDAAVGARQ